MHIKVNEFVIRERRSSSRKRFAGSLFVLFALPVMIIYWCLISLWTLAWGAVVGIKEGLKFAIALVDYGGEMILGSSKTNEIFPLDTNR